MPLAPRPAVVVQTQSAAPIPEPCRFTIDWNHTMDLPPVPDLRFLHTESTLNRAKLEQFRRLSTGELTSSLAPGKQGSLKVRPDGTILDGHHRISVLAERGEDIHQLPREI